MRTCLLALALAGALSAQSPLTTTFNSSTFLAASGTVVYFDLNVRSGVQINQMDVNFYGVAALPVSIAVWVRNGTHIGNNTSSNGWTQVGATNTVPSNGRNVPTPMMFTTPIVLQPGLWGVAVQHNGTGAAYTAGTQVGAIYSSTAEMDFIQGGASNPPIFGGTQNAPRVMNCSIYYQPLGGYAAAAPYGTGCDGSARFASYYENFVTARFDLGGTATVARTLHHTNTGTGYVATPGGNNWFTPLSAPLPIADETISAAQPLGFTFTAPGVAPTTNVWISDNGYLWLTGAGRADFTPAANELLTEAARMCPCWIALNPATGSIYFDSDPLNGAAYVTWSGLSETGSGANVTMQVALFATGDFEYRWAQETLSTQSISFALVGYSPGGGRLDPGNTDISAAPVIVLGPDQVTANMTLSSTRPVQATTMVVTIANIPAGTVFGTLVLSAQQILPGIQPIPGLGTCVQLVGLNDVLTFLPSGPTQTFNMAVPAAQFTGAVFHTQAVTLSPTVNAAGVASSNGLSWTINPN